MSDRKIGAVEGMYEAFGKGDVDSIVQMLADDVDWAVESDQKIARWYGRRTSAEVPAFFDCGLREPRRNRVDTSGVSPRTTPTSWW